LWTAQDAVELGFRTHVLWDLTRPVSADADADLATRVRYDQLGVEVIDSSALG
jgi:nicotinamidase/pyrazinamidase